MQRAADNAKEKVLLYLLTPASRTLVVEFHPAAAGNLEPCRLKSVQYSIWHEGRPGVASTHANLELRGCVEKTSVEGWEASLGFARSR